MQPLIMEQLMLFQAETPASQAACRENSEAKQIIDTSGHNIYELLMKCSRHGLSTKMFRAQFLTEYWTVKSAIWKLRATPAGRPYLYLVQRQAPYIKGKGFFWWPTPLAGDSSNSLLPGSRINRVKGQFQDSPSLLLQLGLKPGTPLSVRYYECLMGLPNGWLRVSEMVESEPVEMG